MESELLKITKATLYPCVLILQTLAQISQNLAKLDYQSSEWLTKAIAELNSHRDLYQLTAEIESISSPKHSSHSDSSENIVLRLEQYIKPFTVSLKGIFAAIAQIDRELSRSIGEIQNIVHWLESHELDKLELDLESQEITELLVTRLLKRDLLETQLKQHRKIAIQNIFGNQFDQEVKVLITNSLVIRLLIKKHLQRFTFVLIPTFISQLKPIHSTPVEWCLENFRDFAQLHLNSLKNDNQLGGMPAEVTIFVEEVIGQSELFTEHLPNGANLELVKIVPGNFVMGSDNGEQTEQPRHSVELKTFYLGKYPITQAQYQAVMGENPAKFKSNLKNPVDNVSWEDAQNFCQKLSQTTGKNYQLASEAQWEYACAAGTETPYYFGEEENNLADYAWYADNAHSTTHPVGLKKPNAWGLYDMYGNVWEWCEDTWHKDYGGATTDGSSWHDKRHPHQHVLRGGSWHSQPSFCRTTSRYRHEADHRNSRYGFRIVLSDFQQSE